MNTIGPKMKRHEEELKAAGLLYVPSVFATKSEILKENHRRSRRKLQEFFDPSSYPYYETNTITKIIYVHNNWDSSDDKMLERLLDGQKGKEIHM